MMDRYPARAVPSTMTPSTDSLSTNPTVPIATDKYGAPLSLPRKQTSVTPVLNQFENRTVSTPR